MTKEQEIDARKNWRHRWLGAIFRFAHLEYQKGLWFDHKYPNQIGWTSTNNLGWIETTNCEFG